MTQTKQAEQVLVIDPTTDATETAESAVVRFQVGGTWANDRHVTGAIARRLFDSPSATSYGDGSYTVSREDYEAACVLVLELQRHNGQNPYGAWLAADEEDTMHGSIPEWAYDAAMDESLESGEMEGHLYANGQHFDWRRR